MTTEAYSQLVHSLQNWTALEGETYDFNGMVGLLGACLDNLRKFGLEAELEEIGACLEPGQIEFLRKLCSHSQ